MIDDGDMSYPASPSLKEGGQRIRGIERSVDTRCPYCHDELEERRHVCSGCDTAYHTDCWDGHGGCSLLGCSGSPRETAESQQSAEAEGKAKEKPVEDSSEEIDAEDASPLIVSSAETYESLVERQGDFQRFVQREKDQEAISEAQGRQMVHIMASFVCAGVVGCLAYVAYLLGVSVDNCTVAAIFLWALLATFVNTWIGIKRNRSQQGANIDPDAPNVKRKLQHIRDLRNKPPDH